MVSFNQKGFTLLELMVVLAVISIVSIGALSSYRGFDQTKKLEADTEAFIEAIELAKKQASSGQKPCVSYMGQYSLTWGGGQFLVTPTGCASIQSYVLSGNEFATATSSAVFNPLGRGTQLNTDLCVLIRNKYHDQCRKVIIETSGTATSELNPECSCM